MFLYSTEKCGKIVENDSPPFLCEKKRWSQKKRSIRVAGLLGRPAASSLYIFFFAQRRKYISGGR
jgi:hypothetical protein